jgi:hypothetical protein
LTIAPGASVQPIEIVLRDDMAHLDGTVSEGTNEQQIIILAIPEGNRQGTQRTGTAMPQGQFEFQQLAPGSYTVMAVDRADELEYRNPVVMQKYMSKTQEITLGPNQSASVKLELIHVRE